MPSPWWQLTADEPLPTWLGDTINRGARGGGWLGDPSQMLSDGQQKQTPRNPSSWLEPLGVPQLHSSKRHYDFTSVSSLHGETIRRFRKKRVRTNNRRLKQSDVLSTFGLIFAVKLQVLPHGTFHPERSYHSERFTKLASHLCCRLRLVRQNILILRLFLFSIIIILIYYYRDYYIVAVKWFIIYLMS